MIVVALRNECQRVGVKYVWGSKAQRMRILEAEVFWGIAESDNAERYSALGGSYLLSKKVFRKMFTLGGKSFYFCFRGAKSH